MNHARKTMAFPIILALVALPFLANCGSDDVAESPSSATSEPAGSTTAAEGAPPPLDLEGEDRFLTPEKMEQLREERKDAIDRESPLGEENDPLEEIKIPGQQ